MGVRRCLPVYRAASNDNARRSLARDPAIIRTGAEPFLTDGYRIQATAIRAFALRNRKHPYFAVRGLLDSSVEHRTHPMQHGTSAYRVRARHSNAPRSRTRSERFGCDVALQRVYNGRHHRVNTITARPSTLSPRRCSPCCDKQCADYERARASEQISNLLRSRVAI